MPLPKPEKLGIRGIQVMSGIVSVYYDILDKDGNPIESLNPGDVMSRKFGFALAEVKELEKMYIEMIEKINEMTQFVDSPVIQKPETQTSDITDPIKRKRGRPRKNPLPVDVEEIGGETFEIPEDPGTSATG